VAKYAVRVGDHHVGVQTSSRSVADLLERRLAGSLVDDPDVPGNLSIYEGTLALGDSRPVLRVYEGCSYLFTATTRERAVEVVTARLEGFLPTDALRTGDLLALRMAAVLGAGRALLVPSVLLEREPALERRLRRDHLEVHPGPFSAIDVPRAELVLPAPWGVVDRTAREQASLGRFPVIGWAFDTGGAEPALTRAHAVARALTRTVQPPGAQHLERLASLSARSVVLHLHGEAPEATIRATFRADA
jgi:hypothetical protein